MTPKQKAFCEFYIASLNATEAAIKAGYSKKTARKIGHENLTKLDIQKYINERLTSAQNQRVATAQEVLEYLTSVVRSPKEATKDRIKAATLLGERYSVFSSESDKGADTPIITFTFRNCAREADDD